MSKSNIRRCKSQNSPALGAYFPESLRQKLSEDLQLSGMAKRTHDGYIRAIRQLSDFTKCAPDQVTEKQVRKFFLHLKNDRGFAYGPLPIALSGVKFVYTRTCKRDWDIFSMLKLQNITALPEVLTIRQTHELTGQANTLRIFAYFWTAPLVYHPHIHYIIPGGGVKVDETGAAVGWQSTPQGFLFHHGTLIRVYKAKLADERPTTSINLTSPLVVNRLVRALRSGRKFAPATPIANVLDPNRRGKSSTPISVRDPGVSSGHWCRQASACPTWPSRPRTDKFTSTNF